MKNNRRQYIYPVIIAAFLATTMGVAASLYGWHSTPGILLAMANVPGSIVAAWLRFDDKGVFLVTFVINSLFYCTAVQLTRLVYRSVSGAPRD